MYVPTYSVYRYVSKYVVSRKKERGKASLIVGRREKKEGSGNNEGQSRLFSLPEKKDQGKKWQKQDKKQDRKSQNPICEMREIGGGEGRKQ